MRGADDDALVFADGAGGEQLVVVLDEHPDDAARADLLVGAQRSPLHSTAHGAGEQALVLGELADGHDGRDAVGGVHADEVHQSAPG